MRPLTALLILLLCLTFGAAVAQQTAVDAFLQREMTARRIPGLQVAVVHHGQIVLLKSYGVANVENAVTTINQHIFAINSATKAFTGVAIMQLVEEGKLALSAPIGQYVDSLPASWQPITIHQLLTHVSGLPDVLRINNAGTGLISVSALSEQVTWKKVKAMPLDFPTGEQFSYNQTNYALLGKVIEKLTAKPFAQFFSERQFEPAGMRNTVFGDSRDVIPNMVPTYRYVNYLDGQPLAKETLIHNYAEFQPYRRTASGLNSTAEDLAHWLMALQQGKLFKNPAMLRTLWTAGTYNNGTPTQWALGWVTKPRPTHRAIMATGGGRAALAVYPDDELAVVVLTNLAGASPEDLLDELAGYFNPAIPAADPITSLRMQLRKSNSPNALAAFQELRKKNKRFQINEVDLNDWAYRLLSKQPAQALELFKLNVWLYPDSWNAYDSYGEALLKNGHKEEAIKMYQKSVALNPNNHNGQRILERVTR